MKQRDFIRTENLGPASYADLHNHCYAFLRPNKGDKLKVLFWNTGKQKVDILLSHMASENLVDLIILAEYDGSINHFIDLVNHKVKVFREVPQIGCKRITVFIRDGFADVNHGPETNYYTAKKLVFSDNNR